MHQQDEWSHGHYLCTGSAHAANATVAAVAGAAPPMAYSVALEFAGTSPNFHYSNAKWTNSLVYEVDDSSWPGRKESARPLLSRRPRQW